MINLVWKIGPALAAGNTVVIKPSEAAPLVSLYFAELINEAGFPPGVINIVNGTGESTGKALAEHLEIEKVGLESFMSHVILRMAVFLVDRVHREHVHRPQDLACSRRLEYEGRHRRTRWEEPGDHL